MYSQEEYLVFAKEFLSPRLEKCREQMAVILNKKGNETRDALLSVMEQLFQRCIRQQKEGVKKPIRYISTWRCLPGVTTYRSMLFPKNHIWIKWNP